MVSLVTLLGQVSCYIAVSSNDQLLVADYGHHCISIFTLDGNYVGKFGTQGTGRGQLSYPSGIATDMYGFILVTEDGKNHVTIFNNKEGVFIHSSGSKGYDHGQFSSPHGIAVDPTGDIYVSDAGNKRIQNKLNAATLVTSTMKIELFYCYVAHIFSLCTI